ncbi:Ig-like domain-containing protein, partial [bacterium]|nr:Ig-like domain-containing protein [candidate division CSSED10-310 bacterium]
SLPVIGQTYRFVDSGSPFPGSGFTSWDTASHTIQQAINGASSGDFIFVADGVYTENVVVDKDVWIESWCREPTDCVIQPANTGLPTVRISDPTPNAGTLVFHGFQLLGPSYGVYVTGNETAATNFPIVSGCLFVGYSGTAFFAESTVIVLEHCTFVDNLVGAHLSYVNGTSWVRNNIFAHNSMYGLQVSGQYLQMGNNCYYSNGDHIHGAPTAYCDKWSADLVLGIDPQFVNYSGGDFHLMASSPCVDYDPGTFGYPSCYEPNLYDKDESRIDLGAYGGNGSAPTDPAWVSNSRSPSPWTYRVAHTADISFGLEDWPAGIDPDSVQVRVSNHGHPDEVFQASDLLITLCDSLGTPPSACNEFCYEFTLLGSSHQPFTDYAYVRVEVNAYDNCPSPNTFTEAWRFHADDLTAPQLVSYYPANGQTGIPLFGPIVLQFTDSPGIGIDRSSIQVTVNSAPLPVGSQYLWDSDTVTIYPAVRFTPGIFQNVQVSIADEYNNLMPGQTFGFTTGTDNYPPFVPGVSVLQPLPTPPPDCGYPNPPPGSTNANPFHGLRFVIQDYESPVDVTNLIVTVQTDAHTWVYSSTGTNPFQIWGTDYCKTVYCSSPAGAEGWGIDKLVTVHVAGARDQSPGMLVMIPEQWTFTTVMPPVPVTGTWTIILLLAAMGLMILHRRG